ncbi:MAG: glycoside hydrolase [Comamonadaceae bacterium]|nr:glycoside hydrolase family 5 protein [Rhodoferax sp.]TSA15171.1 MAG: glycoside hydrolase [Comamonadaceae bacterium]
MLRIVFLLVQLFAVAGYGSSAAAEMSMLRAQGSHWVKADGQQINLKGVNLGNWLMLEFWMMGQSSKAIDDQCTLEAKLDARFGYAERERLMKLFRDNWMTQRDWDMLPRFGLNLVRLPFIWSLVEDEQKPRHLRADAWFYLDEAIRQAEARGMYVILDLHGAVGSQGVEHHSGCANRNLYWNTPEYQERTLWLWGQVAARYKDRASVAGYSLLNEPWGTSPEQLAQVVQTLYERVRAVDPNHVIILPGHNLGIDAYGKPETRGMRNVAFEMHFYPGFFGWGQPGAAVHRDWFACAPDGTAGSCEWKARMKRLNTAFFVGEFQPWADVENELAGQVTRATFDAYADLGWASAAWSYKLISNDGGQGKVNWGLVTNADGVKVPALDFASAPLPEIEALFKQFGSVDYLPHAGVLKWMNSAVAPEPFKLR